MKQNTTPLNALQVNSALRKGTPASLRDSGGLRLQVTDKNKGSWIFRGRLAGTQKVVEVVCGHAPEMPLSKARAERDRIRLMLREGINPNEEKRAQKQSVQSPETEAVKTFRDVAAEYFEVHRDLAPRNLACERGRVRNHMKDILDLPVASIQRVAHLKPIMDKLISRGQTEQARRVGALLGRIMNYAFDCGYVEASPADRLVRIIPKKTRGEQNHFAAAVTVETASSVFQRLWASLDSGKNSPYLVAALKLSCYTPIRNANLIEARWQDIDLDKGTWFFPKTKNGRTYTLPLTRQAKAIFEELQAYHKGEWCFPSWAKSGHVSNGGLMNVLRKAGVPQNEQCLHGFRSTFQSIALAHGLPKAPCEQLLFHVAGSKVQQAYIRTDYRDALLLTLQWWADAVDCLRQGNPNLPEVPEGLIGRYQDVA